MHTILLIAPELHLTSQILLRRNIKSSPFLDATSSNQQPPLLDLCPQHDCAMEKRVLTWREVGNTFLFFPSFHTIILL